MDEDLDVIQKELLAPISAKNRDQKVPIVIVKRTAIDINGVRRLYFEMSELKRRVEWLRGWGRPSLVEGSSKDQFASMVVNPPRRGWVT
jgi:hypothetical protein